MIMYHAKVAYYKIIQDKLLTVMNTYAQVYVTGPLQLQENHDEQCVLLYASFLYHFVGCGRVRWSQFKPGLPPTDILPPHRDSKQMLIT